MNRARFAVACALALWALPAAAAVPPVLVQPHADTLGIAVPPAPLIIPGRPNPADSIPRTRARMAQEQYALGRALERQNHPAAAISAYRKAVRIDPTIPGAHYRMGRLFSAVSQHKVAADEYQSELVNSPKDRDAMRWLGLEQAQCGDTASAISRLRSLVELDPADEPSWQALGFVYSVAQRPDEGEDALRRALSLDPMDADAWRDLGVVSAARGDSAGARDAYLRAGRLSPGDPGVWIDLGNMERRAGHPEAALEAYAKALARDSAAVLAWRGEVAVYEETGRPDEAARVYRTWLSKDPADTQLREQAMEHFDAIGRRDIALELARDGVRISPKSAEAHLMFGMALHEDGHEAASLEELRRSELLFVKHESAARVGALIRAMRRSAPDSLRAVFAADSVMFEGPNAPGRQPPMLRGTTGRTPATGRGVPADSSYSPRDR